MKAPKGQGLQMVVQRAKSLKKRVKEETMSISAKEMNRSKSSKSRRNRKGKNGTANAMTLTMKKQRDRLANAMTLSMSSPNQQNIVFLISSKWWRAWHDLPDDSKLNESDRGLLTIDNAHLIDTDDAAENELSQWIRSYF